MSDNKFTATEFKRIMETHHLVTVLDVMHAKRARAKLIGDTDEQQNIEAIGEIISRFIDYKDYLGSDHWREKVEIGLQEIDPLCAYCCRTAYTLHHRIYHRVLFREVIGKHVFPVCQHCHEKVHNNGYKPANKTEIDKLLLEHGDLVGKLIPN